MFLSTGLVLLQQRVFHFGLLGFRMLTYLTPTSCSLMLSPAVPWRFLYPFPMELSRKAMPYSSSVPQESRAPLITLYQRWILGAI